MPRCYQLIGVPASGKSTWAHAQEWFDDCAYISTDVWVELEAKKQNRTYSEIFTEYMPTAVHIMTEHVKLARKLGRDIIWDQTSTSVNSRRKKFNMLPEYEHIAVVFPTPEPEELTKRLTSRPGKNIPAHVMESMINNLDAPTEEEGFKEIWRT